MSTVTVNEGRVCIVRVAPSGSNRDSIDDLYNVLSNILADSKKKNSQDLFIFIDLASFTVVNSSLIGLFGSIIMDKEIKLLGLCGLQVSVLDILQRFGIIEEKPSTEATEKVKHFKTLEAGLSSLA